jgi:diaminohydroxyphosphoribosylaminopyrimidine deaminase / 5-amino-6-(5-phosphoribosylamino)uracil reductase
MTVFDANDRRYMKKALDLAEKGLGLASPNPSVGCVLVRDGHIIGRGWHEYALLDHAEVGALQEASENARGATAYATLEPCCHQGRTPPCADRLIKARVRRVVVARIDPNPRVSGQGIKRLRAAGIQVDVGLMQEEAGAIIEPFACRITSGIPLVISKVGMSLDGKIGTAARRDRWITSPESREFSQVLRLHADAVLAGVGTVLADDPALTYRGKAPKARPMIRVVLDSGLRMPATACLFRSCPGAPVLVFCGQEADPVKRAELEKQGAETIAVPSFKDGLDLRAVLLELGKRDVLGVLVEGGSRVHWSFLSNRMVDKFYFVIAPLILGGKEAVPSVGGAGYEVIADSPRFRIRRSFYSGPDIVLEAYPSYSRSVISPWLSEGSDPSRERYPLPSSKRK